MEIFASETFPTHQSRCPYPHVGGKTNPMTADEWMQEMLGDVGRFDPTAGWKRSEKVVFYHGFYLHLGNFVGKYR